LPTIHPSARLCKKLSGQLRDVLLTISQLCHLNRKYVYPIVQILTVPGDIDFLLEITIGRSDDVYNDVARGGFTYALERSFVLSFSQIHL